MNNRVATLTLLVIASLLLSPVVVADDTQDIPTNAQNTGIHDSLVAALSHAELVSALQADGPFTVFAPTDDAFVAAGIDLSTFDTEEENATLADILLYHVVSGEVTASAVTDGMNAEALNGDDLSFTVAQGVVMVNDATVTSADVMASNGVIHVIDKVLMPPADEPAVTEADGDICYNTVTHTVVAGASFEAVSYTHLRAHETV